MHSTSSRTTIDAGLGALPIASASVLEGGAQWLASDRAGTESATQRMLWREDTIVASAFGPSNRGSHG